MAAPGQDDLRPAIGQIVEELRFKDIRFLTRNLSDLGDANAYVIVATNTTCPLVQRYLPKLRRLEETFRPRGVRFVSLNVAPTETIPQIAMHAVEMDVPFPVVQDIDGQCVAALGLRRTPEAIVLDANRRLRYRGRIDDQYRLGGAKPSVSDDSLNDAIRAVLSKQQVTRPETNVDGCLITGALTLEEGRNAISHTYSQDVRPLVQEHCVQCHRAGTEAPFALGTYEEVSQHGQMIAEVVRECRMPPWYAAPMDHQFENHRGLSPNERLIFASWVASGMARGEFIDEQPLEPKVGPWQLGEPSLVLRSAEAHQLPAEGYVPYKYAVLPYRFEHETWVRAIEIVADNAPVLHHCNLLAIAEGKLPNQAEFITGKVPGSQPLVVHPETAIRVPAGTTLMLQIHYTTTGKPESCRISVGLTYAAGLVNKEFRHVLMKNTTFRIPPQAAHYRVDDTQTLDRATTGLGLFSHMHVRGKDMTFWAHYPDGTNERLLTVPNYSFDWQQGYRWPKGARRFPAGTRFEVVAHFDNSDFNPFNPDSTATVREGQQTFHEMMYGFYFFTYDDEQLALQIDAKTGRVRR